MPAQLERYKHRNAEIGSERVYVCEPDYARLEIDGVPVEDGARAVVIDAVDFDYPFTYRLEDGRVTRSGGHSWRKPFTAKGASSWSLHAPRPWFATDYLGNPVAEYDNYHDAQSHSDTLRASSAG